LFWVTWRIKYWKIRDLRNLEDTENSKKL
jgi:hypothetical protein